MSDIPADVSREILKRVSVESLFRLRSVCKSWCRIIDDPLFLKSHFLHPTGPDQLIITSITGQLYTLPLNSLDFFDDKVLEARTINNLLLRGGVPRVCDFPVPSCDGLILIPATKKAKVWLLWNPFNGTSMELPLCDDFTDLIGGDMPCSGIGYDSATNDYKIVRVAPGPDDLTGVGLVTFVYSLSLNAWHRIQDVQDCVIWDHYGVFAYGALHFVAYEYQGDVVRGRWMLALDLTTETYRKLPLPSKLPDVEECSLEINSSGECLFLSCSHYKECVVERFDVWMVKDYGCGDDMWVKGLKLRSNVTCSMLNVRVVTYLKSKDWVLIQLNSKEFMWYDLKNKGKKIVTIGGIPDRFTSQVFPASLIRFNGSNLTGDDEIVVSEGMLNKRKRGNERLE